MAEESMMSPANIKAMMPDTDDGIFGGNGFWIIILFLFLFGGNGFGGWGNNSIRPDIATKDDVNQGLYQQTMINKLDANTYGIADATYALNNAINGVNISTITSANETNRAMSEGFANVSAQMNALGYQMQSCCCDLKTQMLQDKYDAVKDQLVLAETAIANATQTQNILNSLGTYYPNPPYVRNGCQCG